MRFARTREETVVICCCRKIVGQMRFAHKAIKVDDGLKKDEAIAFAWMGIDSINDFPMSRSQKRRIQDVMEFYKSGKKRMG